MGTKTWLYGGVDTLWTTNGNWVEGSPPSNGDEVTLTGSTMPSTGPGSTLTLQKFDSSQTTAGFGGGSPITQNIVIASGGTLLMGNANLAVRQWWHGDASEASVTVLIGHGGASREVCFANAVGDNIGNNAILRNVLSFYGKCGSGCRFYGNSVISTGSEVGANAEFYDTAQILAVSLGAGAKFYGNHTITSSVGNVTLAAGNYQVYGQAHFVQAGAFSVTFGSTVNLYLIGLNSKVSFAGTFSSSPISRPVQKTGSQLAGALP